MKKLLAVLAFALFPSLAFAQNPQCPTRPVGDNSNACASTAFVTNALSSGLPLAAGKIYVGSAANLATATQTLFYTTAVCDGTTNDVTAINAAITAANAAGGGTVQLPTGTCAVGVASVTLLSKVYLQGYGLGSTTLKLNLSYSSYVISGTCTDCGVRNLTIDAGDFDGGAASGAIAFLNTSSNWVVDSVEVKKMGRFGIIWAGSTNYTISNNIVTKTTAATAQNQALLGICSAASTGGKILNNILTRSAIDVCDGDLLVQGNYVSSWKFGAGLTTEQSVNSYKVTAVGNTFVDGTGQDDNGYDPAGIEMWSRDSIAAYNVVARNSGAGIDWGSQNGIVVGNLVVDNSQFSAGGSPGINCRYGDATYNCSNSTFDGNQSYNTLGAAGPQSYGYSEQSASITGIKLGVNIFDTNRTGRVSWASSQTAESLLTCASSFAVGDLLSAGSTYCFGRLPAVAAGSLLASAGVGVAPVYTATPTLGVVSATTGQIKLANASSAFLTTIQAGNAAAARTYTWPTNFGAAGTVLTDAAGNGTLSWVAASTGTVTSIATTSPITGGTITTTGTIACATCVTSAAALTANQIVIGGGLQASAALGSLGTATTVLHGNAGGAPTFAAVVSADLNITTTTCTNQFLTAISATGTGTCTTDTLAGAQHANQGTTTTVLHGNGAGNPSWTSIVSADLNITTTTCTNQFLTAISATGTGTCTTDTLASAQHANQGTTTTVLHGNGAGNPSFAAVSLTADISGVLAGVNGGTGLSTAAIGDIIYASATTPTWARLADVATGSVLVSGGTSTAPAWSAAITVTTSVTSGGFIPTSSTVVANGMYLGAANQLNFSTASASRWTLDVNGNNALTGNLSVAGATINTYPLDVGAGVGAPIFRLNGGSSGAGNGPSVFMAFAGSNLLAFGGSSAIFGGAFNSDFVFYSNNGGPIHWYTNSTEYMQLSAAGQLKMLATTDATTATTGTIITAGGAGIAKAIVIGTTATILTMGSDTAQTDNSVCINSAGLLLKGTGTLGICLGTSGRQFKQENTIRLVSDGLEQVSQLRPLNYFYKPGHGDGGFKEQYGFVAQDVIKVLPGLVGRDEDGEPNTVDILGMVPVLVRAIQELQAKVDQLRH